MLTEPEIPSIAGRYKGKKLVICGDASCVWGDLERFGCKVSQGRGLVFKNGWHFMTVNKLVECFPGNIEHCYSNEGDRLKLFVEARRNEYRAEFSGPEHLHARRGVKWCWPWRGNGSSALGACLTSVHLGYDEIVLAGVPLDNSPHNGEPPWRRCTFEQDCTTSGGGPHLAWKEAIKTFGGKVKSLSGQTREWLGEP